MSIKYSSQKRCCHAFFPIPKNGTKTARKAAFPSGKVFAKGEVMVPKALAAVPLMVTVAIPLN